MFDWLQSLRKNNCSTLIVHHANKTTGDQRGSSIKSATVDNVIRVKKALPGQKNNIAVSINIEKGRDAYGEALDPFTVMLKFSKNKVAWTSTKAKGVKEVSLIERNKMILDSLATGAFSQQIIADYFGINVQTLKAIVAAEKIKRQT